MRIPSIEKIGKIIDVPNLMNWKGNCFSIAYAMVKNRIVSGKAVYGHFVGNISPNSYFSSRRELGFCHHGWIRTKRGIIIDPTRWVFENKQPYIAIFKKGDKGYEDYDEGGNFLRELLMSPPPQPDLDEKSFDPPKNLDLASLVASLLGRPFGEPIYFCQLLWLANLSPNLLRNYAKEIYLWITDLKQTCLIPLDNRNMILGD